MAAQQFKVRNGLISSANLTFEAVPAGSQATGGKILVLDNGANVVYRTNTQLVGDLGVASNTDFVAGNGVDVSFDDPSTGSIKYTLGTPSTLNTSTSDATTTSSHTHAITYASDASAVSVDTILAANTTGGLKLAVLHTTDNVDIGGDLQVTGNTTISGSLQVDGTLTYVNTTNLQVSDPLITLSQGGSGAPSKDQGLMINRGASSNVAIVWDESEDEFIFVSTSSDGGVSGNITISDYFNVHAGQGTFDDAVSVGGNVNITDSSTSTSTTTGALKVSGGVGVAENIYAGANVVVEGTASATNTTTGSIQTDGGVGVAKDIWVGQKATVVGNFVHGVNQELTRISNTVTVSDSSSSYLFQVPLASYTGAEVLVKLKAGTAEQQVRKVLIAENGTGSVDYTEYGSIGHGISVELAAETTNGLGDNAGSTHIALKATNSDGTSVVCKFTADFIAA